MLEGTTLYTTAPINVDPWFDTAQPLKQGQPNAYWLPITSQDVRGGGGASGLRAGRLGGKGRDGALPALGPGGGGRIGLCAGAGGAVCSVVVP